MLASLAALKHLTSELIGRFSGAAVAGTREVYGAGPLTRYAADLVVPRQQRLECALLKGLTWRFVVKREGAAALHSRQRVLIGELAAAVAAGAPLTLDPVFRPAYLAAEPDAARMRVVVDQIASLTDTSAIAWHRRLCATVRSTPAAVQAAALPGAGGAHAGPAERDTRDQGRNTQWPLNLPT
jgi:dGTPase